MDLKELLELAIRKGASDLHITENTAPILRIDGELVFIETAPLTREQTKRMIYSILNDRQKVEFEKKWELDFSLSVPGLQRFRVNLHIQRGSVEAAFRIVSLEIPTLKELNLPPIVETLVRMPSGLILVTGPTGVGKTTTLASIVNLINSESKKVIVIIEDPIEYVHTNKKSIIKQREVYSDTQSFALALRQTLRQDPDVIIVGEMRDLETISTALTAAETGHLVLATLHTSDAPQTIDRIIDVFPPYQQKQIMVQLSNSLQGIVSQKLLPRQDKPGRIVACEIMTATPAVRNLIREQQTEQMPTLIQTGAEYGMITMDKYIKELYVKGIVSYEAALARVKDKQQFTKL